MSRELRYTAIVLKKQPFSEGDEIITFFTKEQGKVRALAKSIKLSKSKLAQKLQSLFLVELQIAGGQLPKIIGAEPREVFSRMRENMEAVKIAFYAQELVLKFTPDEHKNEELFNLFLEFLRFLDSAQEAVLGLGLAKFKMAILQALGLAVNQQVQTKPIPIFFSAEHGGFTVEKAGMAVPRETLGLFTALLKTNGFLDLAQLSGAKGLPQLQDVLSQFIEYQLERKVKSEGFLKSA